MSRPPRSKIGDTPFDALGYEIVQEQASTLGRLGRRLEATLAALATFDAETPLGHGDEPDAERCKKRAALVREAGTALWHLIVQREVLGLRDTPRLMREYGVPNEVRDRMGMLTPGRRP